MKRWPLIAWTALLSFLASLGWGGVALAQEGNETRDILSQVVVPILVIVRGTLDYFVVGNTLTDPKGEQVTMSLATIIHWMVLWVSELTTLLVGNTAA